MPDEDKPNKPSNSAFRQQRLKAWQPILTPKPVIAFFFAIGIIFIPLGIILYSASESTQDFVFRYDESCANKTTCAMSLNVTEDMEPPIYFYYRLTNFYQNHRRYVKSRDDYQLRGNIEPYDSVKTNCDPIVSAGTTEAEQQEQKNVYFPCGLIAWSMFNDTFSFDDQSINMTSKGIAWPSDVDGKFRNPPGISTENATAVAKTGPLADFDIEDEHFIVWMRTAALPDFRKLFGVINKPLKAGVYNINITNNFPVRSFGGTKSVVLATTSWLGGKNPFLGIAYMVVGGVALLQALLFLIKHIMSPRKLGDTSYLRWST